MNPTMLFRPLPLLTATLFAVLAMILLHPAQGTAAALRGIAIWWDVLFPSLLPFFVLSELMLGFGIVHFFGTLLDPIMRPLFRVPGIGGFVMAMGFASSYPVGARLTSKLREEGLVTREEGERLVAFTTTSDPIFLIGAVSIGFYHNVKLAAALAAAHYGAAILIGLLMRFHGRKAAMTPPAKRRKGSILKQAFEAMHEARLLDGRPFGAMLEEAIRISIRMIFVVGGLVVFFSVILEMMTLGGLMEYVRRGIGSLLQVAMIPTSLSDAVLNGLFEVTLGAKSAGEAGGMPLVYKAAAGAFVLSWSGLSVHAQIVSLLHTTDIRYGPFLVARLLHGLLAAGIVLMGWNLLYG